MYLSTQSQSHKLLEKLAKFHLTPPRYLSPPAPRSTTISPNKICIQFPLSTSAHNLLQAHNTHVCVRDFNIKLTDNDDSGREMDLRKKKKNERVQRQTRISSRIVPIIAIRGGAISCMCGAVCETFSGHFLFV